MRVKSINAQCFGPLTEGRLDFASGLTVVVGGNESAKSSWHAALYAGLCGMRRGRGKPRAEDVAFEYRHAPWSGDRWSVQVECELRDGRELQVAQDLREKSASVVDLLTGADLAREVLFEGTPDLSRLLGLDRRVFARTAWVRQADVMSVREEPEALKVLMQTAISASGVTATDALRNIAEFRHQNVGVDRSNSVRPLRMAVERAFSCQSDLEAAVRYQQEVRSVEGGVARCSEQIAFLEQTRTRLVCETKSFELVEVSKRIDYLRDLQAASPDGAPVEPSDDHARYLRVREVLTLWAAQPKSSAQSMHSIEQLELRLNDLSSERESRRQRTAHLYAAMALVDEVQAAPQLKGPRSRAGLAFGLMGVGTGILGLAWQPAYVVSALCFAAAVAMLRRVAVQPEAPIDTRARVERLLVGQDLPAGSLIQRFAKYVEATEAKERGHAALVADIEFQLDAARRDEVSRAHEQAQRYEARDALSAATISIGTTSQEDAAQDVELLESWCGQYLVQSHVLEGRVDQWKRLQIEQERTPIDELLKQQARLVNCLDGYEGEARNIGSDELFELDNEVAQARESRAELSGQLKAVSLHVSVSEAEVALDEARRELARIRRLDETLIATADILQRAEEAAYRLVAPRIQQRLGVLVAEATNDRYARLTVSPEDLLIRIETGAGEWSDAQQLSHGTAELVYLLLRIVLAEQLCAADEIAPLFFDDVTVHFDNERTVCFLELLHKLSVDRQIIVFSQEASVEAWANCSLSPSQILQLKT